MEENIWDECEQQRNARLVYNHLKRKLFWAKMRLAGWILALVTFLALTALTFTGCAAKQPIREYSKGITLDVGAELRGLGGFYPSAGLSFPVGPTYLSTGVWGVRENGQSSWGHYLSVGWSWSIFE